MNSNFFESLKEKKNVMKVSVAALVGALAVCAGAALCSASAMPGLGAGDPPRSEEPVAAAAAAATSQSMDGSGVVRQRSGSDTGESVAKKQNIDIKGLASQLKDALLEIEVPDEAFALLEVYAADNKLDVIDKAREMLQEDEEYTLVQWIYSFRVKKQNIDIKGLASQLKDALLKIEVCDEAFDLLEVYAADYKLDVIDKAREMLKEDEKYTLVQWIDVFRVKRFCKVYGGSDDESIRRGIIELRGTGLYNHEMEELSNILKDDTVFTTVIFDDVEMSSEGVKMLAEILKSNTTIEVFQLGGDYIGTEGVRIISKALKKNTTVTDLTLSATEMDPEGSIYIADLLKSNSTLLRLDISYNDLKLMGIDNISNALKVNSTLISLNLTGCISEVMELEKLFDALLMNSTLISLSLMDSDINAEGAGAISIRLKLNSTLTELNLPENDIGDEGAGLISEALKHNSTLTSLSLFDNRIGEEGTRRLSEALKHNSTLTSLHLGRLFK